MMLTVNWFPVDSASYCQLLRQISPYLLNEPWTTKGGNKNSCNDILFIWLRCFYKLIYLRVDPQLSLLLNPFYVVSFINELLKTPVVSDICSLKNINRNYNRCYLFIVDIYHNELSFILCIYQVIFTIHLQSCLFPSCEVGLSLYINKCSFW